MIRFDRLFSDQSKSRGETIVEVLLATVILSTIIAGAYTLSNRATRIGQSSIERTEAVNLVESMTETLRGVSTERGEAWNDIVSSHVGDTAPSYADITTCAPTVSSPFYLDIDNLSSLDDGSVVVPGQYTASNGLFDVWIEAYEPSGASYIDFHVRTCWDGISASSVERATAVLRINTGSIGTWAAPTPPGPVSPDPISLNFTNSSSGRSGTIQSWTVPEDGEYTITAFGAQGGGSGGGMGARMEGRFTLNAGDQIRILVGQRGISFSGGRNIGGGGGTFVVRNDGTPLLIAGGGGGSNVTSYSGRHGRTATTGAGGSGAYTAGGGSGGSGGSGCARGGGGGGFSTNGTAGGFCDGGNFSSSVGQGGFAYLNGGRGGSGLADGGFGGGGSADGVNNSWTYVGGGGGYSGGGAASGGNNLSAGGGGGSYIHSVGTLLSSQGGVRSGHGRVEIRAFQ